MSDLRSWPVLASKARWAFVVVAIVVMLLFTGRQSALHPEVAALTAGATLCLAVVLAEPAAVALLVMPLLVVPYRLAFGETGFTLSDAALAIACVPAAFATLRGVDRPTRTVLWFTVAFQFAALLTVIQNPYLANAVKWVHQLVLVSGAVLVGWCVGRRGFVRSGFGLLILGGLFLAFATIVQGVQQLLRGDFGPVYPAWPFFMHKNFVGTMMALMAAVAYARPVFLGWRRRWTNTLFWVFVLSLGFSQSRQAILGLAAAIAVMILRRRTFQRRRKAILLVLIPAVVGVSVLVRDQVASGNQFNSVFQRVTWFQDSVDVWLTDPWLGVGLRWWYTDRFSVAFQPPNAEVETLTSTGVVGLVAFIVMLAGVWSVARRLDPRYGEVIQLVLIVRIVQSQFDLFWVSIQVSVPFVIAGLALGALAHNGALSVAASTAPTRVGHALHPTADHVDEGDLSPPRGVA